MIARPSPFGERDRLATSPIAGVHRGQPRGVQSATVKRSAQLEPYLHLYVLAALCGAHPLLDVLARHPEFFVAKRMEWAPPLLAAALVLVAPLALVALRMAVARAGTRPPEAFDVALVAAAAAVVVLQALHGSVGEVFPRLALVLAAVAATAAAWCRARWPPFRTFLSFLAPALVVVPLVFLLDPRVARLGDGEPPLPEAPVIDAADPVIVVIFDALSASALMDAGERINARRYPRLAAVAEDAVWFTSASTVARWTVEAVPAMLTGDYPRPGQLPRFADHPRNFFTVLGGSYRVVADEVVDLCPRGLNAYPPDLPPWRRRLAILASDLGLVYLHRTLPERYARRLPAVDRAWGGFADPGSGLAREIERFHRFLDVLDADADRTLYMLHVVIPHKPYLYLPSGKLFRRQVSKFLQRPQLAGPGTPAERRPELELESGIFTYKRYLFQVGLVERLVGELVDRLQQLGLYQRSTLVLTADHGGRNEAVGNPDDMLFVPLLIKPANAAGGRVERRPVSTLDLLPSLLDLLGAEPEPTAGGRVRSFFRPDYRLPESIYLGGELEPFDPGRHAAKRDLVAWKLDSFGDGSDPRDLYRAGTVTRRLLDARVDELTIVPEPALAVELDLGGPEITYDPSSGFAPVLIEGSLFRDGDLDATCCEVAVSVNGRVEATAVARPYRPPDWLRFRATVPESALRPGANDVRAWIVDPERLDGLRRPVGRPASDGLDLTKPLPSRR